MAVPARAQQITLEFNDGLVTVDTTSAPVGSILNEWAKRGGTKVVGGERLSGAPLTLKLVNVPEAQALEIILRSVAGYMAAPRGAGTGASIYDRILVMATSAAPPPTVTRGSQPNPAMTGTQRFVPPRRVVQEDGDNEVTEEEEPDPNPPNPPVFTFPGAPGQNGQPGTFISVPPNGEPNGATPTTPSITISPSSPTGYPTTMPFGTATPGMISAPPQPQQPGVVVRPPGRDQ